MQTAIPLADFIRAEIEPILQDWEAFAKTLFHARHMGKAGLRDHAREMLLAIADGLNIPQSESEQAARSKSEGPGTGEEDSWAEVHGEDRQTSGFSVVDTVSEFRALRASVVSHWTRSHPTITSQQVEELTRFHEAIDQSVAESLEQYTTTKEMETRLFGAILVASPDPIYVLNREGKFIYANKATADLFALDTRAIVGKSTFELGFPFAADFNRNFEKVMADQSTYRGKFAHTFASGKGERFEYLLAPVLDEDQNTEATVCISRDITEQALAEEAIWHTAHHDYLTGLPNRRLFLDRLEQEVRHAKRNNLPIALLFLDLDGFKSVNDSLGHEAGDHVLCDVAGRLADCVRDNDTIARLGGDEFTVILTAARQRWDIGVVAQTIIDALAVPFQTDKKPARISASVGIAFYPGDASTPLTLLQAADHAMYVAKSLGSNRMCFFSTAEDKNSPVFGG
jgi:diguanylate cyclase (GGDEF)-like protein/PAS domain S-box-containing protein